MMIIKSIPTMPIMLIMLKSNYKIIQNYQIAGVDYMDEVNFDVSCMLLDLSLGR